MTSVLVHYHEIALKGKNRPLFVRKLIRNIERACEGIPASHKPERRGLAVGTDLSPSCGERGAPPPRETSPHGLIKSVRALPGRLLVELRSANSWPAVRARLSQVMGIANFALAERVDLDVLRLAERAAAALQGRAFSSFRVSAKRVNKQFPLNSMDVERLVGTVVKAGTGARVDLGAPELTVYVEVLPREAYFYFDKLEGARGLPVGASGKVAVLLSGGIDSPVAAWRMMRRGCRVVFIHFHSVPFLSPASQEKVKEIVEHLTRFQYFARLHLVRFGEVQRQIKLEAPAPLRVVLYRRAMMRIATAIALRSGCRGLVTGESLGQVASQTLENLGVIEKAAGLPVLRPLVGMDKDEITSQAKTIGTYEMSIQPDQDCCQLFIPPHPATHAREREVEDAERHVAGGELETSAARDAELVRFGARGRAHADA